MHRRTRFLSALGVALITAGILQLTFGDKYRSYAHRGCHFGWHKKEVAPSQKPGEDFKN